jgi:hypothetical protein
MRFCKISPVKKSRKQLNSYDNYKKGKIIYNYVIMNKRIEHLIRVTLGQATERACDEALKIKNEGKKLSRLKFLRLRLLMRLFLFTGLM